MQGPAKPFYKTRGFKFLATSVFMFLVTWVLGIASTSMADWYCLWSSSDGPHEGLWTACFSSTCESNNKYTGGCLALLNTVRAFSIITIILGFFAMVLAAVLWFMEGLWAVAVLVGFLAFASSILPWTIYLGFLSECGYPTVSSGFGIKGSGWTLAVAAFPCCAVGFFSLLIWTCHGRAKEPIAGAKGGAGAAKTAPAVTSPKAKPDQPPVGQPVSASRAGPTNDQAPLLPYAYNSTPYYSPVPAEYYPATPTDQLLVV